MLVLSRKMNESIVIGENIVVTVIDIRGDKIRLGIEAPRHVSVHRREIYERIKLSDTGGQPRQEHTTPDIPDIRPD
jgi:carbon storage regulator